MPFYSNADELNQIHNGIENLMHFITNAESKALKTEHHLGRIDPLNTLDKSEFDAVDIQLIKKFLIHTQAIDKSLSEEIKNKIGFNTSSIPLLQSLAPDNDMSESFYLSSAFNPDLEKVRKLLTIADKELNLLRKQTLDKIKHKYGIDLSGRDFVLIDNSKIDDIDNSLLVTEFYDSTFLKVKAAFNSTYLDALVKKEQLLIQESEFEKRVLKELSNKIKASNTQLKQDIECIKKLDILLAKARLAIKYQLVKPQFSSDKIVVEQGIYYPLFEKHHQKDLRYTPLNACFSHNAILLSGSNMGGKTVLFKTMAFLQLLTQMGFFVPAKAYSTRLFSQIIVLGAAEINSVEGLSSFGQEIHQLSSGLDTGASRLLFVDELAKTTNATEAKAILYAVLRYVVTHPNITGFFSTHFIKIPNIEGVAKYRMNGLDKEAYLKHCDTQTEDIEDKIRQINAYMQYEVSADDGNNHAYDALTIAKMLGLQSEIIKYANDYLDN